ncbi:MAG: ATP-binding protein [Ornithinimicrobium sp.]
MGVGEVHLLYGLAGSGKTTLGHQLARRGPAVRFTLDEWMIQLYPDLAFDDPAYGQRAEVVKDIIWSVAEQVLRTGTDVVLDWNSWSRERRAWTLERARSLRARVTVHCLQTSAVESSARADNRAEEGTSYAHRVTRDDNEHLAALMEPPSETEGLRVVHE